MQGKPTVREEVSALALQFVDEIGAVMTRKQKQEEARVAEMREMKMKQREDAEYIQFLEDRLRDIHANTTMNFIPPKLQKPERGKMHTAINGDIQETLVNLSKMESDMPTVEVTQEAKELAGRA